MGSGVGGTGGLLPPLSFLPPNVRPRIRARSNTATTAIILNLCCLAFPTHPSWASDV